MTMLTRGSIRSSESYDIFLDVTNPCYVQRQVQIFKKRRKTLTKINKYGRREAAVSRPHRGVAAIKETFIVIGSFIPYLF